MNQNSERADRRTAIAVLAPRHRRARAPCAWPFGRRGGAASRGRGGAAPRSFGGGGGQVIAPSLITVGRG